MDDAKGYDVINLLKIKVLHYHLLVYAIDVFRPTSHLTLQIILPQLFLDDVPNFPYIAVPFFLIFFQAADYFLVYIGIEVEEEPQAKTPRKKDEGLPMPQMPGQNGGGD